MKYLNRLICKLTGHKWTCKVAEGIKPTDKQITVAGFKEYSKIYCKRCKHSPILHAH